MDEATAAAAEQAEAVSYTEHREALAAALRGGQTPPAGRLLGLPELPDGDVWVDIAGAAAIAGVPDRTITGWRVRGGPRRNPFPKPIRVLYRLYWRLSYLGVVATFAFTAVFSKRAGRRQAALAVLRLLWINPTRRRCDCHDQVS